VRDKAVALFRARGRARGRERERERELQGAGAGSGSEVVPKLFDVLVDSADAAEANLNLVKIRDTNDQNFAAMLVTGDRYR
jgi:hypothetical protein